MSFLSPFALLLATLAVPLLLLYFLKVRRRQIRVSSLLLWEPSLRDQRASAFFQRLQRDPLRLAPMGKSDNARYGRPRRDTNSS
jgi:hypothetical protein